MSETPRNYSSRGNGFSFGRPRRSRRIGRLVIGACGALLVYAFWISRDTHAISEFIQADRRLEIVVPRANVARHRFVESRVWEGVPPSWAGGWPEALADTRGLPDWVVGNLVGSGAVAVADDLTGWSDVLVASRMTRIGCVIERILRVSSSNSSEWAGGLHIRFWKPGSVFYAVRGRSLLVSPSRDALVAALTLTPEKRVVAEAVRAALTESGGEDARGTITFRKDEPFGAVFSELKFAARIEEGEAVVKLRTTFRSHVSDELRAHLANTKPVTLDPPFAGPVTLTADFGTNVEDSWRVVSGLVDVSWLSAEKWEAWQSEGDGDSPAAILTALLSPMGTSFRVAWQGTDLLEMAPTPILVGSIEGSQDAAAAVLDSMPKSADARTADASVYFDRETSRVEASLISGPSMSPVAQWEGDTLFFSTSATAGTAFFADGRAETYKTPRPGNLYLRVNPIEAMRHVVAAGEDLAASGLLREYSEETFQRDSAQWLTRAGVLESFEVLASVTSEHVDAEWYVKCAPNAAVE